MPQQPLLVFPQPTLQSRARAFGGGGRIIRPSAAQQKQRLDAKFQHIAQSLHDIQATVQGIEPEQVIVLETLGTSVDGLAKATAQVPGPEWLAEMELEEADPDFGFAHEDDQDKKLSCRLYAIMSNQVAMNQLLSLWSDWVSLPQKRAKAKFGPFKRVFEHLKDVRRWGPKDRIRETKLVEYLKEQLELQTEPARLEIELWCRTAKVAQERAFQNLSALATAAGGTCITQAVIPEIMYHGVLAELPPATIEETVTKILNEEYTDLVRCEDAMFFRPVGQARFSAVTGEVGAPLPEEPLPPPSSSNAQETIVALLDGLPLEHHTLLDGRLVIDDPDGCAASYQPNQQRHGTAMASLIIHGDRISMPLT